MCIVYAEGIYGRLLDTESGVKLLIPSLWSSLGKGRGKTGAHHMSMHYLFWQYPHYRPLVGKTVSVMP